MPMLLSTPKRWFRTRQCDFYEFRPAHGPDDRSVDLPAELTDWLAASFPDRELQPLGPSEHSGWISGGPSMKVLALNTEEVQRYSQRWEDANGTSLDPRWQCFQWPYQMWRDRCARIQVTAGTTTLRPRQWGSWIGIQRHAFHVSLRCGEVAKTRKRMALSDALCRAVTDIRVHDAQPSGKHHATNQHTRRGACARQGFARWYQGHWCRSLWLQRG